MLLVEPTDWLRLEGFKFQVTRAALADDASNAKATVQRAPLSDEFIFIDVVSLGETSLDQFFGYPSNNLYFASCEGYGCSNELKPRSERSLSRSQPCNWNTKWTATDVVQTQAMTEFYAGRVAAMLAANTQLDVRPCFSAKVARDFH